MRDGQLRPASAIKDKAEVVASDNVIRPLLNGKGKITFRLRHEVCVYTNSAERVERIDVSGVEFDNPLMNRGCGLQAAGAGQAKKRKQFEDFWIVAV